MIWKTREDFLGDQNIEITGYQVDFEKIEKGFFLFNHHKCKTTLGIKTFEFKDLYNGPVFTERKTGSRECPSYCLYKENLDRCLARCACAYIRDIIQLIKCWPKNR